MIEIAYAPRRARGEGRLSEATVRRVAEAVSKALRLKEDLKISVALVDRPTMRGLNRRFRGKDRPTDVLAFQYNEPDGFGEVLVCPAYAREQARQAGRPLQEEMVELLIHGLLHVFGYDHVDPKDAKIMLPLQQRILTTLL